MTVKGLERLERRLKEIPAHVRSAIRESMARSADAIVARMKQKVAQDTGALAASISWTWGQAPKGTISLVQARADGLRSEDTITIFAGGPSTTKRIRNSEKNNSPDYDYALAIEFGVRGRPADPFFFVTWKQMKNATRNRQRKGIRTAIQKSAA